MIGNYYDSAGNLISTTDNSAVVEQIGNNIGTKISNAIGNRIDIGMKNASDSIIAYLTQFFGTVLDIIAIGIIGYMFYQCIRLMFIGKDEIGQKIMLSFFCLILVRVLNTVIGMGGIYGTR